MCSRSNVDKATEHIQRRNNDGGGVAVVENPKPENASHIGNSSGLEDIGETVFDKGQATRERSDEHLDIPSGGGSLSLSNTFLMDFNNRVVVPLHAWYLRQSYHFFQYWPIFIFEEPSILTCPLNCRISSDICRISISDWCT
jgi:hypothetical protein